MSIINAAVPTVELIKLENGDIALRRSDKPEKPLITISFAEEAQAYLKGAELEVARIMIQAGAQGFGAMQQALITEATEAKRLGLLH